MRHLLAAIGMLFTEAAIAQEASVPSVTTASPGGYANPLQLDTDRYRRNQRRTTRAPAATPQRCSADAMPAAQRRQIEREYARRVKANGRASAHRWAAEQGRLFRAQLVREGVCDAAPGQGRTTVSTRSTRPKARGKCTKTVMQARNIANPGGGAMSMIMVPVCVN